MLDGRRVERVFGETMREIGILVIAFLPLDAAFAPNTLTSVTLTEIKIAAFVMIGAGIIMESRK